jgi:hypothetical protein
MRATEVRTGVTGVVTRGRHGNLKGGGLRRIMEAVRENAFALHARHHPG